MGTVERKYEPRSKGKTGRNGLAQIQRIFTRKYEVVSTKKLTRNSICHQSQNYKVTISNRDMDRVLEAYLLEDCREKPKHLSQCTPWLITVLVRELPVRHPSGSINFRIMVAAKALAKIDALLSSRAFEKSKGCSMPRVFSYIRPCRGFTTTGSICCTPYYTSAD